jgi:hypothetical protein
VSTGIRGFEGIRGSSAQRVRCLSSGRVTQRQQAPKSSGGLDSKLAVQQGMSGAPPSLLCPGARIRQSRRSVEVWRSPIPRRRLAVPSLRHKTTCSPIARACHSSMSSARRGEPEVGERVVAVPVDDVPRHPAAVDVEQGRCLCPQLSDLQPACFAVPAEADERDDTLVVELAVLLRLDANVLPCAQPGAVLPLQAQSTPSSRPVRVRLRTPSRSLGPLTRPS